MICQKEAKREDCRANKVVFGANIDGRLLRFAWCTRLVYFIIQSEKKDRMPLSKLRIKCDSPSLKNESLVMYEFLNNTIQQAHNVNVNKKHLKRYKTTE